MARIIWLASYPKSGNTWVRAFLANLFTNAKQPVDIDALDRFSRSLTARGHYDAAAGRPTRHAGEREVLALRNEVQRSFCAMSPDNVFVKTHSRFGSENGLPLIAPELTAGAIYVVRNPLDVAMSAAEHFGVTPQAMVRHMSDPAFRSTATDAHVMDYVGSWSDHVASWTVNPHPKLCVLRYEDLYVAPESTFARLAGFLGLSPPAERLQRAVAFSSFGVLSKQEESRGFKERAPHACAFFRRGRPGEGREKLDAASIDMVERAHRSQMARFGYLKQHERAS